MSNQTLTRVAPVLDALHAQAEANDETVLAATMKAAAQRGATSESDVADVLTEALIPIDRPNGLLLHALASARRPGRIVEFGTSMGVSAIYLAAALRPGEPPVVATELDPVKVSRATANLTEAGLAHHVDLREGDAFTTLADFDEPISLLFLDGWKRLYLPMLELLEERLVDGAYVVADDTVLFEEQCRPLIEHLRNPANGYASAPLEVGDGMEIAVRVKPA